MKNKLPIALATFLVVSRGGATAATPAAEPAPPVKVDPAPKTNHNTPAVPPISVAPTPERPAGPFVYDQKPVGGGRSALVQPQQAQAIVDRFKAAYSKLGNPRIVIFVNRELVDEKSGLKMIARTEKTDSTEKTTETESRLDSKVRAAEETKPSTPAAEVNPRDIYPGRGKTSARTEQTVRENRYRRDEAPELSLADKQTVRDVERLFGRPLRMSGANLADQRVASQLLSGKNFEGLTSEGEQARKDREALSKVADVVVEVLISSKNVQVSELSGERTYSTPDIQATAIRLQDAKILGQAASSDIAAAARNHDVREVAEATALALMEDMITGLE